MQVKHLTISNMKKQVREINLLCIEQNRAIRYTNGVRNQIVEIDFDASSKRKLLEDLELFRQNGIDNCPVDETV